MKFARTIGIVVGVVALAATGVGLALGGATAAAATAAAGTSLALGSTLMTVGAIASVAAGLISVATAIFAPKPGFSGGGNQLRFQTNPQSGLPYAIGRTRMSGLRIHADTYDSTYKSEGKDDALSFAFLLSAGGEIEGIETFKADKTEVTFDVSTGMAVGAYSTWMAQRHWEGGQQIGDTAVQLAFGGANVPGWTTEHKLSGMTHGLWTLRFDPKGNNFGAGVPEPEWIGKFVKVYDPRQDSTYPGGSGDCRALDESTYVWSANPFLHGLTWALGRWQNGKKTLGIGAPIENIRVADFVEGANVSDANGWNAGGVEWSTDPKWTTLKRMLQAGGGEPTMTGAMIGCRVNTPRVSIATIAGDKLHDSLSIATTRSRRDRFNTAIPRLRSEDHDWEIISGSPVSVSLYITEDGGPRTKEIDFPLVQHERDTDGNAQAGQLACYEIVNSREAGPIIFTGGPEYVGLKTGDCITLDVPEEGLDAQKVLIRRKTPDAGTFKFTFECETETDAKHDFALGKTTTPPPSYEPTPPDLTPPTPADALWTLAAETTGGVLPGLRVTGVCEFPGADLVLIEYREVGAPDWISAGVFEASTPVDFVINSVEGATSYEARVSYKSGSRNGDWLVLDPVSTPTFDLVDDFGALDDAFNARNDRDGTTPVAPTMPGGGAAIDHSQNDDGSVDISSQITYSSLDAAKNDGFEVEAYSSTSNSAYTPGSSSDSLVIEVPAKRRSFVIQGGPANVYYTFAWRAFRDVDDDVWDIWAAANATLAASTTRGRLVSAWVKSTVGGENPYLPNANPASLLNILGTIDSLDATIVSAGFDPVTGKIATGKVITDSVLADAITQTVFGDFAAPRSLSYANRPDYLFIVQGSSINTHGGRVHVNFECLTWLTYAASGVLAGTNIGVEYAIARSANGSPSIGQTLANYVSAGAVVLATDLKLMEVTHDGSITSGTITTEKRNLSAGFVDETPPADFHSYSLWARLTTNTGSPFINTDDHQTINLTEMKK